MLEVYDAVGSVCCQKVRFAVAEKEIDWVNRAVDLRAGEQTRSAYLNLNPRGIVPTLVHDGRVVTESSIICEYLDDIFPAPPLRPTDPHERTIMRKFAKIPDDAIHTACSVLSNAALYRRERLAKREQYEDRLRRAPNQAKSERQRRILDQGFADREVRAAVISFDRMLAEMEDALRDSRWLAGSDLSLADIGVTPYVVRLDQIGLAGMWDARPGVARWYGQIRARPAFGQAIGEFENEMNRNDADAAAEAWREVQAILGSAPQPVA